MLVKQVVLRIKPADMCNVPLNPNSMTPSPILLAASASVSSSGAFLDAPVINPISRQASDAVWDDRDHSLGLSPESTDDIRKAAKQIIVRCIQRWDGFLGLRAATDSLGRKSGIWRNRFESVRYASLLLAIHKYNESLAGTQVGNSGNTWQLPFGTSLRLLLMSLLYILASVCHCLSRAQAV